MKSRPDDGFSPQHFQNPYSGSVPPGTETGAVVCRSSAVRRALRAEDDCSDIPPSCFLLARKLRFVNHLEAV